MLCFCVYNRGAALGRPVKKQKGLQLCALCSGRGRGAANPSSVLEEPESRLHRHTAKRRAKKEEEVTRPRVRPQECSSDIAVAGMWPAGRRVRVGHRRGGERTIEAPSHPPQSPAPAPRETRSTRAPGLLRTPSGQVCPAASSCASLPAAREEKNAVRRTRATDAAPLLQTHPVEPVHYDSILAADHFEDLPCEAFFSARELHHLRRTESSILIRPECLLFRVIAPCPPVGFSSA